MITRLSEGFVRIMRMRQARDRDSIYQMILIAAYISIAVIMPRSGHQYDMQCWATWIKAISLNGIGEAYSFAVNYNPLFLYVLRLFGYAFGIPENIDANVYLLKLVPLAFDFGAIYLLMRFLMNDRIDPLRAFLILFNMAFLYNTVIWGQVDSIHTFLVFAAFLAAFKGKTYLSALLFLLSLNMKLQAIIFLPSLALLLIPQFVADKRRMVYVAILLVFVQGGVLMPFLFKGEGGKVYQVVFGAVGYYPVVSMNAFNLWHLLLSGDLSKIPDSVIFLGMSYKNWGLTLFMLLSALILLPVATRIFLKHKQHVPCQVTDYQLFFLSFALIVVVFFYFNTQMHERYVHPAILFMGIYAILSRKYVPYILVSCGYVLNLEGVLQFLRVYHHAVIFKPWFISLLFLTGLLLGITHLYKLSTFKSDFRAIRMSIC